MDGLDPVVRDHEPHLALLVEPMAWMRSVPCHGCSLMGLSPEVGFCSNITTIRAAVVTQLMQRCRS